MEVRYFASQKFGLTPVLAQIRINGIRVNRGLLYLTLIATSYSFVHTYLAFFLFDLIPFLPTKHCAWYAFVNLL